MMKRVVRFGGKGDNQSEVDNLQKIRAVVCLMLAGALCPCAFGLNPALEMNQYAHKAWTVRDGFFKGSVYAIAQTPDGYLWMGTEFGVARFDGVRSVDWQPPNGEHLPGGRIRSLLAARDGRLWIGTDKGLASWKNDKLTQYAELAGKFVLSLLEDHEGTIWAAAWGVGSTDGRLCTIRDGHVRCHGDDGRLSNGIDGLYEDRGGKLWAGGVDGVWRWKPEPTKFFPMPIVTSSFAEGDGGELFITTRDGVKTLINEHAGPYLVRAAGQQSKCGRLLRDRDGGLWVGTYDGGLLHVHKGRTDRFTHSDGLSSDNVLYLFEDREGSIWVGTRNGLDRFREFVVPTITEKQGLSNSFVGSIVHARDGSIWLGTLNGLDRWKNGDVAVYGKRDGLPDPYVLSLSEDDAGRIWVSTPRGMAYLERGKFVRVRNVPSGSVICIVGDGAGGIWISDQLRLYHLHGQTVIEEIPWIKLGHKDFAWTILPDSIRGGLWFGFRQGGVAYYKDHSVRLSYGREQGFGEGQVSGLKLDDDGSIWAATGDGLNLIRNGHSFRLSSANGLPCDMVHWLMEDSDHVFWLYTACGLVRLARSELERWVADPKLRVNTTIMDNADGVRSDLTTTDSTPIVAKSADGKIWFVPQDGVSVIDPHHLPVNKVPPPVHIEQVTADDKTYDATEGLRLSPKVRDLTIDYTALSLVAPEKARFRVKLEGQDKDWKEVINDRKVQYTNLPPKHYRFRVLACNNSGVWNEEGAALDFVIPPAWYQTNWFYAACVGAFLAMVWGIYQLRIRQLAAQFNMRLEERVAERTRVARDLHDTLLQSVQALLPSLQAGINMLATRPADARKVLEATADHASQAIAEGRDAVQGLRMSTVEKNDLALAIRTIGEELASAASSEPSPNFNVVVEGASCNLHPILRDEVYRLATEALRNAFRHAAAQNVEVEIRYDEKYFRLRVRDDGKGIPSDVLSGDGREGHYGLPGMKERAKLVGGKLTIWTELDSGTEIELVIPGTRAYVKSTRPFWYFGKRSATQIHEKDPIER
jgi:signal transduction histidine kinase/ligand-binding sensor domain-containing protein